MIKSKKILSVLVMAVMLVTMFGAAFAAGADADVKSAAALDKLTTSPFKPTTAKIASPVPSGILYVCNEWADAKNNTWVYLDYNGEIYKAAFGVQAFATLADAYSHAQESSIIKFGPGTYNEDITLNLSNIKLYGNYATICPNVDGDNVYTKALNPARSDSSLETVVTSNWKWAADANYITVDGFTLSGKAYMQASLSGRTITGATFKNNIVSDIESTYTFFFDSGYNVATEISNNRIINTSKTVAIAGGAMYDVKFEYNYFEDVTGTPLYLTSCGNNGGIESLISFKGNVFNNCTKSVDFLYTNGDFGANLDYKVIEDNIFFNSGASSAAAIKLRYEPESSNLKDNTDTGCKTTITRNLFLSIPSSASAINFIGADSKTGKNVNYKVTASGNRFIFASAEGGTAISSTLVGSIDASKNYYGECSNGIDSINAVKSIDDLFSISSGIVSFIAQPYYSDYEMTEFSSKINLDFADDDVLEAAGFVPSASKINETDMVITMKAITGLETVDFTGVLQGTGITCKLYKDFVLEKELKDNKVDLVDTQTNVYLIVTDQFTKLSTRYDVVIVSNTDKIKSELRYINSDETGKNVDYSITGNDITVDLSSKYVYFPFTLTVSPSATYKLYTDLACKTEYADKTFYMKPDKTTVIYAKVTSGNSKNSTVYKLSFNRAGSNDDDAKIFSALTHEENILIFNNDRKTVSYRPYSMVTDVEFKFEVSPNATYTIYANYDKATGKLSNPLCTKDKSKAITVGDGISYYYINVVSSFGYSQVYTFITYNDVKSDDNVITGVTGIPEATISKDNVIVIPASSTLAVVNAHFETNVFADVVLYADKDKTFALTPSITTTIVNKREVEERTFQLGVSARVCYYYIKVTSETGLVNEYKLILKKQGGSINSFTDVKGHWAEKYIKEASRLGLVSGTHNESTNTYAFKPNDYASRQEVAIFLCKSMGIDPYAFRNVAIGSVFEDSDDIPEWSYNYVKAVYSLGIMKGDGKNFNYEDNITRQEFFQAISNLHKLDTKAAANYDLTKFKDYKDIAGWATAAIKAVIKAGIVTGTDDGRINPNANITRAEIATVICKENNIVL